MRRSAIATAILLAAALTWLWQKSQSLKPEDRAQVDSALRELRSLDRTINQDVLRARYRLVASYAPVLQSYRRVEEMEAVIARPPRHLDDGAARVLADAVAAYRASVTAKQALIETFKYRTADLTELLAYLPGAGNGITAAARDSGDDRLAASANEVLQLALLYNLTSEDRYARLLGARVDALAAAGDQARSYRVRRRIGTLALNVRRLLAVKPTVDGLLRRIFEEPVSEHEEEVATVYAAGYSSADREARRWRAILYGLCIALLALVLLGVWRLQKTARALAAGNERLEERVAARTRELDARNRELLQSTQVLADVSRRAGMAEIATGVLHNVGNALNSVNVSAELVESRLRALKLPSVARIAEVLEENAAAGNLAAYLEGDAQGKNLPAFLKRLGGNLAGERDEIASEVRVLQRHVEHIKHVVGKQQLHAKTMGVAEPCQVGQLVDDAFALAGESLAKEGIDVARDYAPLPEVTLDRHKVLQILVNLISNARHALTEAQRPARRISARIGPSAGGGVEIEVADNGVGIAPEHLARMFTHGFTTKEHGHGFGLHTSALLAREVGGTLTCRSEGRGHGAAFLLVLPLAPADRPAASGSAAPLQNPIIAVDCHGDPERVPKPPRDGSRRAEPVGTRRDS